MSPSVLKKLTKNSIYGIDVAKKPRELLHGIEMGKKKVPKITNRRKQNCWFMALRLKARNLSTVETAIFLSVKMNCRIKIVGFKGRDAVV